MSVDGLKDWQVLDDLRSIKLPPKVRESVKAAQAEFEAGGLSWESSQAMRQIHNRRGWQIRELRKARLRGRESLGRERMGLTTAEVARLKAEREAERNDLGF